MILESDIFPVLIFTWRCVLFLDKMAAKPVDRKQEADSNSPVEVSYCMWVSYFGETFSKPSAGLTAAQRSLCYPVFHFPSVIFGLSHPLLFSHSLTLSPSPSLLLSHSVLEEHWQ